MASGIEDIAKELEKPTILNVGAELKRNYARLGQLLEQTEPPLKIAEKISDGEFEKMASRAVKERKLYLKLADGKEQALEFGAIDERFNTLEEETRKKLGANGLNINAMIPTEATIRKVAETVHAAAEEKKGFDIGILISAVFNFIGSFLNSLFGKGKSLSWDEAKAQAAAPAVQKNIAESLDRLAQEDVASANFLKQQTGNGASVKQQIIAHVPKAVYEHLQVPLPQNLNLPEEKNPITAAKIDPAFPVNRDAVIAKVRSEILYPQKDGIKGNRGEEIAGLIFTASQEKAAKANATYMAIDKYKHPLDYTIAYASAKMTGDFALKSKEEAGEFGQRIARLVADSVEKSITDPKAKNLGKEEMADLIVKNLSRALDKEKDSLKIVRTVHNVTHYGGKLAGMAGVDMARQLPPATGNENEYAVVTLDTPHGKSTLKDAVLSAVRASVTNDKTYNELAMAARMVKQESKVAEKPQKPRQAKKNWCLNRPGKKILSH
jgi:hypothetical protein